jgi:hypothetical protein
MAGFVTTARDSHPLAVNDQGQWNVPRAPMHGMAQDAPLSFFIRWLHDLEYIKTLAMKGKTTCLTFTRNTW